MAYPGKREILNPEESCISPVPGVRPYFFIAPARLVCFMDIGRIMAKAYFFVTVDAETELIPKGIEIISQIRDDLESGYRIKIPLTWFVR